MVFHCKPNRPLQRVRGGDYLSHFVGVDAVQVIALMDGYSAVPMALPERQSGSIFDAGFQGNFTHLSSTQFLLAARQQLRPNAVAAVAFGSSQRQDMRERRIFFRDDEPNNRGMFRRYDATPLRHPQKIREHAPRVRNAPREALMIKHNKFMEIGWLVSAQHHRHDCYRAPGGMRKPSACTVTGSTTG